MSLSLLMLISPRLSPSPLLGQWFPGPWVSGCDLPLLELPSTQSELTSAQLLSWLYHVLPYLVGSAKCPCVYKFCLVSTISGTSFFTSLLSLPGV